LSDTLDIVCPSCGRTLRIAADHAGKQVRCPACQQISAAPGAVGQLSSAASPTPLAEEDVERWQVRTPEGIVYGPIRWNELLTWVAEGRVAADCELASSADGPWQQAGVVLPVLHGSEAPSPSPLHPAPTPVLPGMPTGFSTASYSGPMGTPGILPPHRGALVLVFGVMGIVVGCPVFSALAWILGSRDLRTMRDGRMDRQGEGITQIGMILGMVVSILWLFSVFLLLTIALIAIAIRF
jgi:hypothetical protein